MPCGDTAVRVVATLPSTAGMFRVDQLVAALAQHTLWLTDAYFAGTTPYVQALCAAARDGVDVRLLVPASSDLPLPSLLSRAGYRPLLEAGVRVFEWNGTMLHAKTAVADGQWARVGSTNLNIASWLGNRELDVIVEDGPFARKLEAMFLSDLDHATEVTLSAGHVRRPPRSRQRAAGGAAAAPDEPSPGPCASVAPSRRRLPTSRLLEPVEAHITIVASLLLLGVAVLAALFPRAFAYPIAALALWLGVTFAYRGLALIRARRPPGGPVQSNPGAGPVGDDTHRQAP